MKWESFIFLYNWVYLFQYVHLNAQIMFACFLMILQHSACSTVQHDPLFHIVPSPDLVQTLVMYSIVCLKISGKTPKLHGLSMLIIIFQHQKTVPLFSARLRCGLTTEVGLWRRRPHPCQVGIGARGIGGEFFDIFAGELSTIHQLGSNQPQLPMVGELF